MDRVDKATRSRIMRAIRSRNTGPELRLLQALRRQQASGYSRRGKGLPGTPDFVFRHAKLAVFVHGCFWHLCPRHYKAPAGAGFRAKMERNRLRDQRVRRQLRRLGWATTVVWEHEDADKAASRILRRLDIMPNDFHRLGPVVHGIQMGHY